MGQVKIDVFQPGKNPNGFTKVKVQFQYYDMTDPKKPVKMGKPLVEIFDASAVDSPQKVQEMIDTITPAFEFMNGVTGPDLEHMEAFLAKPPVKVEAQPQV